MEHFPLQSQVSFNERAPFIGEGQRWTGPWIRGGGEVSRARDFCRSRGSNRHSSSARVSAFTATLTCYCLEGCVFLSAALNGGRFRLAHPRLSLWMEMKPPTPTSPLRCSIELRAGSVQDSDLGFSHRMARAFGALRAAPLLSRSAREDGRIGESAWRLWRVSLCWGSTLGRVKNLGFQAVCLGQNIGTP